MEKNLAREKIAVGLSIMKIRLQNGTNADHVPSYMR